MRKGKILRKRRVKVLSALSELRARWARLGTMECVERLRALIDKGFSRRAIARGLECSEGLIRQLLELESLTAEERQAVSDGSLSVKKALRNVHARKTGGTQRQPKPDESGKATHAELLPPAAESAALTPKPNGQQSANRTEVVRKAFTAGFRAWILLVPIWRACLLSWTEDRAGSTSCCSLDSSLDLRKSLLEESPEGDRRLPAQARDPERPRLHQLLRGVVRALEPAAHARP